MSGGGASRRTPEYYQSRGLLDEQTLDVVRFAAARAAHLSGLASAIGLSGSRRTSNGYGDLDDEPTRARIREKAQKFLPRHLRRRTTSHMRRRKLPSKRRQLKQGEGSGSKAPSKKEKVGRLATHVWHAKRMRMEWRWGFLLGVTRRDQGIRAAYRARRDQATIHDSSYYRCIQLRGNRDSILKIMNPFLPNSEESGCMSPVLKMYEPGEAEGACFLQYPSCSSDGNETESSGMILDDVHKDKPSRYITPLFFSWISRSGNKESALSSSSSSLSTVLNLWVHAAAVDETTELLLDAVERHAASSAAKLQREGTKNSDDDKNDDVNVKLVRLDLARYEVRGKQASSVVVRALQAAGWNPTSSAPLIKTSSPQSSVTSIDDIKSPQGQKRQQNQRPPPVAEGSISCVFAQTSTAAVLSSSSKERKERRISSNLPPSSSSLDTEMEIEDQKHDRSAKVVRPPRLLPPLLIIRRNKRCDHFFSSTPSSSSSSSSSSSLSSHFEEGWDLIAPRSCARALWMRLVLAGGHAIGLEERRGLRAEGGYATFPEEYPHVALSGKAEWDRRAHAAMEHRDKRPKGKRPQIATSFLQRGGDPYRPAPLVSTSTTIRTMNNAKLLDGALQQLYRDRKVDDLHGRILVRLEMKERGKPSPASILLINNATVGVLTFGAYSHCIGRGMGIGYIDYAAMVAAMKVGDASNEESGTSPSDYSRKVGSFRPFEVQVQDPLWKKIRHGIVIGEILHFHHQET